MYIIPQPVPSISDEINSWGIELEFESAAEDSIFIKPPIIVEIVQAAELY